MTDGNRSRAGVLAACTIGTMVSMTPAVHSVFGTFLVPLSTEFGWPRAAVSVVLTIMAVTGAVVYPLAGRAADLRGPRVLLIPALGAYGMCLTLLALTDGALWQFYATFFLVSLFGSVASTPIYSRVVAEWFHRGRGTALGICAGFGNGAGSVLFPAVAAAAIGGYGWRAGYVAVGALVLLLGLPALLLMLPGGAPRRAAAGCGSAAAEGMSLAEAARLPHFWLVMLAVACAAGCLTAIFSHVVPILIERGYGIQTATAVLSTFALTTSAWQVASGRLLDRVQTPRVVPPMVALAIVGLAILEFADGAPALIAGGMCLGIGMGAQYGALPYFIARYFGTRSFGTIIGIMYSAVILAQGVTPVLLDHGFDVQGSYRMAVVAACAALAGSALSLLLLPPYPGDETEPRLSSALA